MEKRGRRPAVCCWLAGAAAATGLFASATFLLKPEPGLLDHATRLANASTWVPGFGGYYWESDHSVLTFRPYLRGVRAVTVDVTTASETDHSALSNNIVSGGQSVVQWRLSRDGQYLLWYNNTGRRGTWNVSDLTGRLLKTWPLKNGFAAMWLADGHSWLESHPGAFGVPFNPPAAQSACTVHSLTGADRKKIPISGPYDWPMGITLDNQVVSMQWSGTNGLSAGRIDWYTYPLTEKPAAFEHNSAPMPRSATGLVEAELSPRGDRIACFVGYSYLSPLEELVQRFLPGSVHPHTKVGLWVIHRDGRGMSLIGSEEGGSPFGLLWTPDGKRVSFVDHGTLYSVQVGAGGGVGP